LPEFDTIEGPKADVSDWGWGRVVSRSETGWELPQRLVDKGWHALQIAVDFVVPEAQYPKAFAGKVIVSLRVALGMGVEIMLAAVDLKDEAVFETDEIYNIVVTRGLSAEVKPLLSP
jgi:hypothetical protein